MVVCLVACYHGNESSFDGGGEGSGAGDDVDDVDTSPEGDDASLLLPVRTWRLTHAQYQRSVLDLLGVEWDTSTFAVELDNGIYKNFSDVGFVGDDLAFDYFEAARAIADSVASERLAAFVPEADLAASAADAFIVALVERAFRRPATEADRSRLSRIFTAVPPGADATAPFRAVVRAVLTSPYFLYRTEIGAPEHAGTAVVRLTDHEIASFVSYGIQGGPPNAALREAADLGALRDPDVLRTHVDALLADPAADAEARRFLTEWLELSRFDAVEKFDDVFPGFETVRPAMLAELDTFLATHGSLAMGSFADLIGAPVPAVDAGLDAFYRSEPSGAEGGARTGVLGLGAVLSQHAKPNLTSPTLRGLFVRERILCQLIELPPGFTPPPLSETEEREQPSTTRELYELHASAVQCKSCHALIDPIGFNLEGFDGAGRFRTLERGVPVDTKGMLVGTDVDRPIDGAAALAEALGESKAAAHCMAVQTFRFYFGRVEPHEELAAIARAEAEGGPEGALGPMVAALMSSPDVWMRSRE